MKRIMILFTLVCCLGIGCSSQQDNYFNQHEIKLSKNVDNMKYTGDLEVPCSYDESVTLLEKSDVIVYGYVPRLTRFSTFVKFTDTELMLGKFRLILGFYDANDQLLCKKIATRANIVSGNLSEITFNMVQNASWCKIEKLEYQCLKEENFLAYSESLDLADVFHSDYCVVQIAKCSNNHVVIHVTNKKHVKVTISIQNRKFKEIQQFQSTQLGETIIDQYIDYGPSYYSVVVSKI